LLLNTRFPDRVFQKLYIHAAKIGTKKGPAEGGALSIVF
jgi:hypothetical protein